jgi:phage terminase large subunit-like protein
MSLNRKEKEMLVLLLQEKERRRRTRKILTFYPDEGPLRRELYPKHMEFFEAGKKYRERCALSANRTGKTEGIGCYETVCHATGKYPEWWQGYRFDRPIRAWICGTTNQTTRDILQYKLLGPLDDLGTGLMWGDDIIKESVKRKASNVPDTIETFSVKHISGGQSVLGFKSYEQGRKSFEGTEQDLIFLDEEVPADIYTECLIRTMTTHGLILLTFTPLQGVSDVVQMFWRAEEDAEMENRDPNRFLVQISWQDAPPHLSVQDREAFYQSIPPHEREARSKGKPSLGSGAVYPISEEDFVVDDFQFPDYWPRGYGFDVGWKATAAVWGAHDRENDVVYIYSCYKKGFSEPPVHVEAIQSRGKWINGVADPASRASSQKDGSKLLEEYVNLGLRLTQADNAVEAGIFDVWTRICSGRLKVFKSCTPWLQEFRMYQRDDKGKVKKMNDHLMDCTRYLIKSGIRVMQAMPVEQWITRNVPKATYNPLTFGLNSAMAVPQIEYNPLTFGFGRA